MSRVARLQQCTALSKRSGTRCRRWASAGLSVCVMHGGGTKAARAKAARAREHEGASFAAERLGVAVVADPVTALLGSLYEALGRREFWSAQVAMLTPGYDRVGGSVIGRDHLGDQRVHIAVSEHAAAIEQCARIAGAALKVGIEARRIEVAEEHARAIVRVLNGVLAKAGIDVFDAQVRGWVSAEIRALGGGDAIDVEAVGGDE